MDSSFSTVESALGVSVKVTLVAPAGMVTEPVPDVKLMELVATWPVLATKLLVNGVLCRKSPPAATEGGVLPSRSAPNWVVGAAGADGGRRAAVAICAELDGQRRRRGTGASEGVDEALSAVLQHGAGRRDE